MKKLMILGGSENQLPLILSAKELGLYVVLCDYEEDNVGRKHCDVFYCVSTLDKEAVLKVAREENIDGIVTNSEPAMPATAYVGNKLGLPSNPYKSILTLSRKDLFREFLRNNGFNCPQSADVTDYKSALEVISEFNFPLMIKPVDSSGSRGVSRIQSVTELKDAFDGAMGFSKIKRVMVEEYIENTLEFMVGGDIFVSDGKVVFWGLLNCIRDTSVNEFVPVGKSTPVSITAHQFDIISSTIHRLLDLLDIRFGAFNVELLFGREEQLFVIEMNPRNGGNRIPEFLKLLTGADLIQATIKAALGVQKLNLSVGCKQKCMSTYILHSDRSGFLKSIDYSDNIKRNIVEITMYKAIGERVEKFENAADLIGIMFLEFDSEQDMNDKLRSIKRLVRINVGWS